MRRAVFGLVVAGCITSCSSKPEQSTSLAMPPSCPVKTAKLAAERIITPVLNKIASPKTRNEGCLELDVLLKDASASFQYDEFKPTGCDWDYGDSSPYAQVKAILSPRGDELSNLCEWKSKDAERSFQRRGEQILQNMSEEDRQTLQRAYEGH